MSNQTVWISSARNWAKAYYMDIGFSHIDQKRYYDLSIKKHNAQVVNSKVIFTAEEEAELEHLVGLMDDTQGLASDWLGMNVLPDRLWRTCPSIPKETKHVFKIMGSCLVFSQACGELLQEFNLGKTRLAKVQIYNVKTQEPEDDRFFYYLDMAEWRHYLLPEKSSNACRAMGYQKHGYDYYRYNFAKEDAIIALSNKALNCDLDLWHDPMLGESIFVSDRLCKALKKAKMFKQFYLKPCDIY